MSASTKNHHHHHLDHAIQSNAVALENLKHRDACLNLPRSPTKRSHWVAPLLYDISSVIKSTMLTLTHKHHDG